MVTGFNPNKILQKDAFLGRASFFYVHNQSTSNR